jgi:hypothetical protein
MRRRGLSPKHVRKTLAYAADWAEDLRRSDLRRVEKVQLARALAKRKAARKSRIIALKTLTAFLRDQGLLDSGNDPGRHLQVPPSVPERTVRAKGYSAAAVSRAYA